MKHARLDYQAAIVDLRDESLPELILEHARIAHPGLAGEVVGVVHDALRRLRESIGGRAIPADEPVFLLRGQDMVAPAVVDLWADRAALVGASDEIVSSARTCAAVMRQWQLDRRVQTPDLPGEDAADD